MQSGYGSVSEIQQFMMENCGSSIFSISSATPPNPSVPTGPADIHAVTSQPLRYRPLHHPHPSHHHHHHQQQPQTQPPLPPHFSHFHSIPITQQLFQQSHQFQLFHPQPQEQRRLIPQHQLGLDQESGPENSTGGGPSFLAATMNFKLAVNESSGGGSREGLNDDDSILQGDDGSESRLHHHWQREEESAIKEPPWRPLDIDYVNRNNKRYKEKEPETPTNKYCKKSKEGAEPDPGGHINGGSNYKLFSELEAIYKPGGSIIGGGGTNRAGSGSALTGDETALMPAATNPPGLAADHLIGGSETSAGEEAPVKKFSKGSGRRKRKRRQQKQLSSITAFFENLVKQLMDHQESLHRKFLEVMERRDQERTVRDEAWRRQEAAKSSREAAARAQERALASSREAAIISFLEKITGETLHLPEKPQFPEEPADATENVPIDPSNNVNNGDNNTNKVLFNTSRWPKAEVHALIRVRSGLESRFQEPGLKGPLWEEVSATMAAMGYHRSSKRCKEKWENINKYFRKTKESGKKRPQHSKTCPYFHQLDQLYSKSLNRSRPSSSSSPNNANVASATTSGTATDHGKDHSELLDAIIVSTDQQGFKFPEMSSLQFDFDGKDKDNNELHCKVGSDGEEDEDDDVDEEGGGRKMAEEREEGEGESQVQPHREEHHQHDSNLFFQCLQS